MRDKGRAGFTFIELLVALGLAVVILTSVAVAAHVVYTSASLGAARCRTFSEIGQAQLWAFDSAYRIGSGTPPSYSISGPEGDRCVQLQGRPAGEGILLRGIDRGSVSTVKVGGTAFLLFDLTFAQETQMRIRASYGEDGTE